MLSKNAYLRWKAVQIGLAKAMHDAMEESVRRKDLEGGLTSKDIESLGRNNPTYLVDTIIRISEKIYDAFLYPFRKD